MTWNVNVDAGRCIAAGVCAAAAPDHFELDGLVATARSARIEPDQDALDAAEACPALAITITEGGKTLVG